MSKKIIEVALPLDAINRACRSEDSPFLRDHPRAMQVWWARRPLAACRAVLMGLLIDDPGGDESVGSSQERRTELLELIAAASEWSSRDDEVLIARARSHVEDAYKEGVPWIVDPFAGRGSISIEALRLGCSTQASDLSPLATLGCRAALTFPELMRRAHKSPRHDEPALVTSDARSRFEGDFEWLVERVTRRASESVGTFYPPYPDGTQIATYLWVRTVGCANPGCRAEIPLAGSFSLSSRGSGLGVVVRFDARKPTFAVQPGVGTPGTITGTGARCPKCNSVLTFAEIAAQAREGKMGQRLVAEVGLRQDTKVYLNPDDDHEARALACDPAWQPTTDLPDAALGFRVQRYGLTTHSDLFTRRQAASLCAIADSIAAEHDRLLERTDREYADALATCLGLALGRLVDYMTSLCRWRVSGENVKSTFPLPTLSMSWDFAEANPLFGPLALPNVAQWILRALRGVPDSTSPAIVLASDAQSVPAPPGRIVVCTDPPYGANIGYANLSDVMYVWVRRALGRVHPDLFSTVLSPKNGEAVAEPGRFGGNAKEAAAAFEEKLTSAFAHCREMTHPADPMAIFYSYKQTQEDSEIGWANMLNAVVRAGLTVVGTWPLRTEAPNRTRGQSSNALASSIVVVCRRREPDAPSKTRREFMAELRAELPPAVRLMQASNIAPVDLAQAAIGPGMAVYSRCSEVLDAAGAQVTVRDALALINEALDEVLTEEEGDFDPETRWAMSWFDLFGFMEGDYGTAEMLSKAKNTSVSEMADSGMLVSRRGKVRLLTSSETRDPRLTSGAAVTGWQMLHWIIRVLDTSGEEAAAVVLADLGGRAEVARELAYRLHNVSERKKRAQEALAYNSVVQSWPEITRLARGAGAPRNDQPALFDVDDQE